MYLAILSVSILASCSCSFYNQTGQLEKKKFICESSPDQQTLAKKEANTADSDVKTKSFLLNPDQLWPYSIVPYELDKSFSPMQRDMIIEAMRQFSDVSCVRWVPRSLQQDYVQFDKSSTASLCESPVGRQTGVQNLSLGDDCFDVENGYSGAILHEMMHAIGFIHEQQRLDRDCYVTVASRGIETRKYDYAIKPDTDTHFPYDFSSIMHYGRTEFMTSKNGEEMGNYEGKLTRLDVMKLNYIYCKGKTYCEQEPNLCAAFGEAQARCRVETNYWQIQ